MTSRFRLAGLAVAALLLAAACAPDTPPADQTGASEPAAVPAVAPSGTGAPAPSAPQPAEPEAAAPETGFRPVPRPPEPAPSAEGEPLPPPKSYPRAGEEPAAAPSAPESVAAPAAMDSGGIAEPVGVPDDGLVALPAGTELEIVLLDAVSTRDAKPGQFVRASFGHGVTVDGDKIPLKQWTIEGHVSVVLHPERKGDRPGGLEIRFDNVRTDTGDYYPVAAVATGTGESARKRNIGVVAGSAVIGAILGKKKGETDEAIVGAAAGAAAGAGIVRALPGKHLDLPEGTTMVVTLTEEARLPARGPA